MRRSIVTLGAIALFVSPTAAKLGDMTLDEFMPVVERLKGKGVAAPFSSEMKIARREMKGASEDYRARIDSDKAAGRTAHSCPPEKGSLNSGELLAHLESYPKSRYASTTVRAVFFDLMAKKYPC